MRMTLMIHLFDGVERSCSCGRAAQLFPLSVLSFPLQLFPLLAPEGQFRGKPRLLMQFLTAARSCSTVGSREKKNIF